LPTILEREEINSVPIGFPISNCEVSLVTKDGIGDEGEISVSGACLFTGYLADPKISNCSEDSETLLYYNTGDFARRLKSGELVFLGRKDRTVKVYGQRFSLEEVESTLREHSDVSGAVVTYQGNGSPDYRAYLVLKNNDECQEYTQDYGGASSYKDIMASIRSWLIMKLPPAMVPGHFLPMKSFPLTSSGKIDYAQLSSLECVLGPCEIASESSPVNPSLQIIKKVCHILFS
jgi:acyl-CoA synthetase